MRINEHSHPTGDRAVDALVALAADTVNLPVEAHKAQYQQVLEGLERELNGDPAAAMDGASS